MIKIIVKGELTDLNSYLKDINRNRWAGNNTKQAETERVAWDARLTRTGVIKIYPVTIKYKWYSKDCRKDIDNVAFSKKFINDGLIMANVLENDSRKFISGFSDEFYIDKENPRVEIEITDGEVEEGTLV